MHALDQFDTSESSERLSQMISWQCTMKRNPFITLPWCSLLLRNGSHVGLFGSICRGAWCKSQHVRVEVSCLWVSATLIVLRGEKMVLMYKWDATRALQLIEQEQVNLIVGVPTNTYDLVPWLGLKCTKSYQIFDIEHIAIELTPFGQLYSGGILEDYMCTWQWKCFAGCLFHGLLKVRRGRSICWARFVQVNHPDFKKYDTASMINVGGGGAAFAAPMIKRVQVRFEAATSAGVGNISDQDFSWRHVWEGSN